MDYTEALEWLYDRQRLGIKLGLDKVHRLLEAVGNPHEGASIVHVAGTNGKGSVCAMMDEALQQSGHKVGRFTSPHLIRFTERILVNGEEIEQADVARLTTQLRDAIAPLDAADTPPTFFEIVTAMALMHFQENGVDWMVLEAGMGGRLDATNVVEPAVAVITNVGLDHERFLGDTIDAVAFEKAGIMKSGVPCVTAATDGLATLKQASHAVQCPMSILDVDYHVLPGDGSFRLVHPNGEAQYDVAMAGEFQVRNAALVVLACDALRMAGAHVPADAVHRALAQTKLPGRLETIQHHGQPVLLDAAHNLDGAHALRRHFAAQDMAGFQLIVGFSDDKPWPDMLDQWAPLAAQVHAVPLRSERGVEPELLRARVEAIGIPFVVHAGVSPALGAATSLGPTVVAGSLFLVGEARALLLGESLEEIRGSQ